jgi:hypothetical protein
MLGAARGGRAEWAGPVAPDDLGLSRRVPARYLA